MFPVILILTFLIMPTPSNLLQVIFTNKIIYFYVYFTNISQYNRDLTNFYCDTVFISLLYKLLYDRKRVQSRSYSFTLICVLSVNLDSIMFIYVHTSILTNSNIPGYIIYIIHIFIIKTKV